MPPIVYFMHLSSMWITRWMSGLLISVHQTDCVFTQKGYFSVCVVFLVFARGEFITLCLLRKNNLAFSLGRKKKKKSDLCCDFMAIFPSPSWIHVQIRVRFVHCSRLSPGPRGISRAGHPGGAGGGGSGPRGWFFFFPFEVAAENPEWQAAKPAVKQGIDWINLSVIW